MSNAGDWKPTWFKLHHENEELRQRIRELIAQCEKLRAERNAVRVKVEQPLLLRIRKLEAVLQWLLWLRNDDLHSTTPVASEAEWDKAWETASELVKEPPR